MNVCFIYVAVKGNLEALSALIGPLLRNTLTFIGRTVLSSLLYYCIMHYYVLLVLLVLFTPELTYFFTNSIHYTYLS